MRSNKIKVFYNPKQVLSADAKKNFSKSPLKPKVLPLGMYVVTFGFLSIHGTRTGKYCWSNLWPA
jgi:hypothetical protein